ncbi:exopolysaccharide production protein ExoZ [Rhizobium sp. BK529]|uniref:acyltransferase family protein n=1 Tax=unclassified Rhizobium TaxID=2613769 RepID=UPI001050B1BE|nr:MULTISPECIES: acyltransferase [unclassified Rhizobium]MBB3592913.1 exopolysaccharide production protein ExoZ [Rhizobium sp. BK529]TCS07294.1 exopolysaccharide production protein ExoZ [Rhizobium sp. BK418]
MLVQLQYLRAFAALMVVYFHAILQLPKINPSIDATSFLYGETGVDIFFVLSGFVMWLTTSGRETTPIDFARKRIRRIVPLYWLATLFSAVVALVAPSVLKSTIFDLPHLLASMLFLPWVNPADPTTITPVVVPGWTLNYEMFFYFVFAMLLPMREDYRLPALFGTFAAILIVCHLLPETTATTFYGEPIILEFAAGTFLGWLYLQKLLLPQRWAWLLLLVGFAFLFINESLVPPENRYYGWGIPAIFIVYSAISIDFSRLPFVGGLNYLGDASYEIYITHAFTLALLRTIANRFPIGALQHPVIFVILCLVLSSIVGAIIHEIITPRKKVRVASRPTG